jgi:DHA1 family bicyclomycin/chloramphenicol resistance-like MFS transporter
MKRKQHFIVILILGALSTISPFSIDMYLPGFPGIAADLNTTIASVQLSLTSYFIGIAIGQLLYGPLLDRYGRKTPLYAGLIIYIIASLACALTTSVNALIAMRFMQALGGCAGMVAAQALVRDLYPVNKTAQAFSSITLVVAVSPMIAPTVGGYVTAAYGWHAVFIILAGITALICFAVHFLLPQGKRADPSLSLYPNAVIRNFTTVIKQPQFLLYTLAGGIATAAPFAYIAGSADVFMNIYGFNEKEYGWIFAFIAFAIIGSTQLNHILLKKFKSSQLVLSALLIQVFIGSILVVGTLYHWYGEISMILLIAIYLSAHGLTNPNTVTLALVPFSRHTGSAASLLGGFRMAMGGLASAMVSWFHNNTPMPMVGVMVLCAVVGLIILIIGRNSVRYKEQGIDKKPSVIL